MNKIRSKNTNSKQRDGKRVTLVNFKEDWLWDLVGYLVYNLLLCWLLCDLWSRGRPYANAIWRKISLAKEEEWTNRIEITNRSFYCDQKWPKPSISFNRKFWILIVENLVPVFPLKSAFPMVILCERSCCCVCILSSSIWS